jgi:hypothetical protein
MTALGESAAGFLPALASYFAGEKRESALFLLAGVAALAAAAALFRGASPWRGMIAPLAIVGVIQAAVGGAVLLRTDRQVAALAERVPREPAEVRRDETARMEKVMAGFRAYKAVEVAIIALGVALALLFPYGSALHAAGAGCLAQGALMLVLDLFAEGRAHAYLAALARLP